MKSRYNKYKENLKLKTKIKNVFMLIQYFSEIANFVVLIIIIDFN